MEIKLELESESLKGLLKDRLLDPTPEFQISQGLSGACLTNPQAVRLMLRARNYTARTTLLRWPLPWLFTGDRMGMWSQFSPDTQGMPMEGTTHLTGNELCPSLLPILLPQDVLFLDVQPTYSRVCNVTIWVPEGTCLIRSLGLGRPEQGTGGNMGPWWHVTPVAPGLGGAWASSYVRK